MATLEKENLKMTNYITQAFGRCSRNEFPENISSFDIYSCLIDMETEIARLTASPRKLRELNAEVATFTKRLENLRWHNHRLEDSNRRLENENENKDAYIRELEEEARLPIVLVI